MPDLLPSTRTHAPTVRLEGRADKQTQTQTQAQAQAQKQTQAQTQTQTPTQTRKQRGTDRDGMRHKDDVETKGKYFMRLPTCAERRSENCEKLSLVFTGMLPQNDHGPQAL